jgi:hypothetical protein
MPITLNQLMAPRLRWARRAAIIAPGLLAILLLISMVMPPVGDAALKAVCILLCTLISLVGVVFAFYILLTGDEQAALRERRAKAGRGRPAAGKAQRTPALVGARPPASRQSAGPARAPRRGRR